MNQNTKILLEMNEDLTMHLRAKEEMLKSAHEKIRHLEARLEHKKSLDLDIYNLKIELLDAKLNAEEQQNMIRHLEETCKELQRENSFLKQPNLPIKTNERFEDSQFSSAFEKLKTSENYGQLEEEATASGFQKLTTAVNSHVEKPKKVKKIKETTPTTMAELLKESAATKPQAEPPLTFPPKWQVKTSSKPRLVVKETTVAKLPKDKTRSLMVSGLYRGLKLDDLVKYFGQFGTVLNCTSPPCVEAINDGAKYVFIKFVDYEAVEKAVVMQTHTIKGVKLTAKKAKDFA